MKSNIVYFNFISALPAEYRLTIDAVFWQIWLDLFKS